MVGGKDAAGESGEFRTFVWDGPGFRSPVDFHSLGVEEREAHRFERLELR